jgi:ABC-type multidrug transport system fused ATPase/permease subunit
MLNESIRENIALGIGSTESREKDFEDSISNAELDYLISDLPDGLDTKVGERGVKLSGGERQRIGIARAVFQKPKVIIFDEATSSLDNITQEKITNTLKKLQAGRTIIIVAHRLKTVMHCDRILLLVNGEVAGFDSFNELMLINTKFTELVNLGEM